MLINQMSSSLVDQFDVIEIFWISAALNCFRQWELLLSPKEWSLKMKSLKIKYTKDRGSVEKEI